MVCTGDGVSSSPSGVEAPLIKGSFRRVNREETLRLKLGRVCTDGSSMLSLV